KRTTEKTPSENDDVTQQREQQQQQQQHRQYGGLADELDDDSTEKHDLDPLSAFFAMPPAHTATDATTPLSYAQWREGRKRFLVRYFEHRLVGVDDDDGDDSRQCGNSGDDEESSFHSEVLDDDFNDKDENVPTIDADRHAVTVDFEADDDAQLNSQPLETQEMHSHRPPTAKLAAAARRDAQLVDDDGASDSQQEMTLETQPRTPLHLLLNTENSHGTTPKTAGSRDAVGTASSDNRKSVGSVLLSGIKRKLGFLTQRDEEEEDITLSPDGKEKYTSTHLDIKSQTSPSCERPTKKKKHATSKRGLMWNADFASIPHLSETLHSITKLNELDLYTAKLDLGLCQILKIWKLRYTKRMNGRSVFFQHSRAALEDIDDERAMHCMNSAAYSTNLEDDGPLNTIYKSVLSIEIVQIDAPSHDPSVPLSSPRVSNLATAAFQSGSIQLQKVSERKRRHAIKRVRIFFYNGYAEALSRVLTDIADARSEKNKLMSNNYLLSLANVPAHCILPHTFARGSQVSPHLQQYIDNPFGDEEYGVPSPYCICIGDTASLKFGSEKLYFDSEELEIRLAEAPSVDAASASGPTSMEMGDAVVTSGTVQASGLGYVRERSSALIERYWNMRDAASGQRQGGMTFLVGDEDRIHVGAHAETIAAEVAQRAEDVNDNHASQDSTNAGEETRSGEATRPAENSGIARPPAVEPLSRMLPLLLENGMKRLKDPVTVYGVVLGFSPPSLTLTKEWKMSIVLIDESLPFPIEPKDQQQAGGCPPSSNATSNSKEVHVPSITLLLFVKNKSHLPVIRSAGDVVCCRNAILQEYNHEPQLLCNRKSSVVVARPARVRSPGAELHDSISPNDWSLSCSCHEDEGHSAHPHVHWPLSNNLWRWGQHRLASHPTMSPNCKISIAGLDRPAETLESSVSGDLTAAITAIIPHPEHLRRRDTPRGCIRLWDGTGPPRSDMLPPDVIIDSNLVHDDPPEKVLVEIEKMLNALASNGASNTISSGIAAPVSLTGRVINATIWEEELWQLIQKEKIVDVGAFVRLRNINNARLPSGISCLSVHARSSLTPLPFDAYEVQLLLKDHDTRIKRGTPTNPSSGILPGSSRKPESNISTTSHPPVQFPMLNECIRRAIPSTFTVLFQISRTIPPFNPSSNNAMKNLCCKNKDGSVGFRFAFHIFDDTAEIDVLCLGAVAQKIIKARAQEIIASQNVRMKSIESLNELMTPGNIFEGEIRSMLGRDMKVYYILKSLVCIQADV
ncbi:hypothetical protein ACHAWX_002321, partial [Stephanocyclus meneghinianus]